MPFADFWKQRVEVMTERSGTGVGSLVSAPVSAGEKVKRSQCLVFPLFVSFRIKPEFQVKDPHSGWHSLAVNT